MGVMLRRGDFVELDGLLDVVVASAGEPDGAGDLVPEDHVALWFGAPPTKRVSEGGEGGGRTRSLDGPSRALPDGAEP
jgi:hypothetical protein